MSWEDFGNGPGVYRSSSEYYTTVHLTAIPEILEELRVGVNERWLLHYPRRVAPFEYDSHILTITNATGGTYILGIDSNYTDPIAYDASAVTVESTLYQILDGITIAVTGENGGPYNIQFTNLVVHREIRKPLKFPIFCIRRDLRRL